MYESILLNQYIVKHIKLKYQYIQYTLIRCRALILQENGIEYVYLMSWGILVCVECLYSTYIQQLYNIISYAVHSLNTTYATLPITYNMWVHTLYIALNTTYATLTIIQCDVILYIFKHHMATPPPITDNVETTPIRQCGVILYPVSNTTWLPNNRQHVRCLLWLKRQIWSDILVAVIHST